MYLELYNIIYSKLILYYSIMTGFLDEWTACLDSIWRHERFVDFTA